MQIIKNIGGYREYFCNRYLKLCDISHHFVNLILFIIQGNKVLSTTLYRFFKEKEHAEAFISGEVRFGTLKVYRQEEDLARGDKTEGQGELVVPGESLVVNLAQRTQCIVPGQENLSVCADPRNHFIYCLSACENAEISELAREFGNYCVVVSDPLRLISDIKRGLANDANLSVNPPMLEWEKVRYDKGASVSQLLNRDDKLKLAWLQKPESYAHQKEFRVHYNFTSHELIGSPCYYTISIGRKLPYCTLERFEP